MIRDEIEFYAERLAEYPFFQDDYCMMADAHNARYPEMSIREFKGYFLDKAPKELYPEVLDCLLDYYPKVENQHLCMRTIFKMYEELCSIDELVGLKTKYMSRIATTLCPTIVIDDYPYTKDEVLAALSLDPLSPHNVQETFGFGYHKAFGIITYLRQRGISDTRKQLLVSLEKAKEWIEKDF